MQPFDVAIIGAGIVGLSTAFHFTRKFPGRRILILDKEAGLAHHQSGHNSGVLHSGIYYKPGSLRASICRSGKKAIIAFCEREGIKHEICGKVIVALDESELPILDQIYERGKANGVDCVPIDRNKLRELEPHAAGIRALHVPETGIVDYRQVCRRLAERILEHGGQFLTRACVTQIKKCPDQIVLETSRGDFPARTVVNCAGLQSDRVAALGGVKPVAKIVPFRGEYYELKPEARRLCRNLIYPVPDPNFPFLGVHFTRMIGGHVECGPNAVLAFAREGYRKRDFSLGDLTETLTYPGFLNLAAKYWRTGFGEMWRSLSKAAFVKALQRLVPEIQAEHLEPAPAGVRAQAVGPDGTLLYDFVIEETDRIINVLNATSPAATASLEIGKIIFEKIAARV